MPYPCLQHATADCVNEHLPDCIKHQIDGARQVEDTGPPPI